MFNWKTKFLYLIQFRKLQTNWVSPLNVSLNLNLNLKSCLLENKEMQLWTYIYFNLKTEKKSLNKMFFVLQNVYIGEITKGSVTVS